MKRYLYLIVGVCFCIITCKKEDNNSEMDYISIGSNIGMHINFYDTVLVGGYNVIKSIDLDINSDNVPDFKFTSEIWGSPGLGQHPKSTILSLNSNCLIYGKITTDTSFLHRSTTIYTESDASIVVHNNFNYSCRRITKNDSITEIMPDQFRIFPKRKDDYLSRSDIFKSDSVTLINDGYSFPNLPTYKNDTVFYNYVSFDYNCDSCPSDEIFYIGIKIKVLKSEKLGWIKLSISDKYKISIIESAIQK